MATDDGAIPGESESGWFDRTVQEVRARTDRLRIVVYLLSVVTTAATR